MGQAAVVVGVGPGLGASLVRKLADEAFTVVAIARHASALEGFDDHTKTGRVVLTDCDATGPEEIQQVFAGIEDQHGPLKVAVFNAGGYERGTVVEADPADFERCWRVGCFAGFLTGQAAARVMLQGDGGRIINICGTAGVSPVGNYAAYCAAKAGLDALTRCMAQALAPRIQVNGVAPGTVLFPEGTSAAERRAVVDQIPAGSIGTPEDIAAAVCFLAAAPDYITGTIVTVDGGASLSSA